MDRDNDEGRPVGSSAVLALLLCAPVFGQSLAGAQEEKLHSPSAERSAVEAIVRSEMATHRIAGLALGIRWKGRWMLQAGYGLSRLDPPSPVTSETRFQIASLTKPITACVVLAQVADGRFALDDHADDYVAWLPEAFGAVTIHELLQHTAGVPRDLRADNLDDFDASEFRTRLERSDPAFEPGTAFQYSNTGYILVGFVVEQAMDDSFDAVLRKSILEPLGMRSTSYLSPPSDDLLHAVGLEPVEGGFRAAPHYSGGFSAGGMTSSLEDLSRWLDALEGGKLLPEQACKAMHSPALLASGESARFRFGDDPEATYGMGWFLTHREGRTLWTHGGAVSGFSSTIDRYPDDALLVIALSNVKGPGTGAIAQRIADLLLEGEGGPPEDGVR